VTARLLADRFDGSRAIAERPLRWPRSWRAQGEVTSAVADALAPAERSGAAKVVALEGALLGIAAHRR